MTDAVVRRRYTEVADVYIDMFGATARVDPEDLGFLERGLGSCEGTVLDAGCGPGHLTAYLKNLGVRAKGIDLVPAFISSARSNWPDLDFTVGSVYSLDTADGSLDGILAWYSLIHCEPAALATVLNEFRRTLRDGGRLVVGFFDGDEIEPFDHKVTTAYRWPVDELSRRLSVAGFTEVERVQRAGTGSTRPHAPLAAAAT